MEKSYQSAAGVPYVEPIEFFKDEEGQFIAQFKFPDGKLRYCRGMTLGMAIDTFLHNHPEIKPISITRIKKPGT